MKKMHLVLSLLVATAMLLAACGGSTGVDETTVPGTIDQTSVVGESTESPLLTPDVTEEATQMGEVTAEATSEATVEATTMPTVDATATQQSTDTAAEPGADQNYVLLSDLLAMPVNDMNGTQVGTVSGVVIDRSAVIGRSDTTGSTGSTGSNSTDSAMSDNPRISYLRVAVSDSTASADGVLIPFAAVAAADSSDTTASSDSMSTADRALTLNIDAASLAGAPAFTGDVTATDWDADVAQYWSDQGLSIPATGAETIPENSSTLLEGSIGDLSVTGMDDSALGNVSDFVVDLRTGEILYALLSGGDTFGTSYYPVPFSHLNWTADDSSMGSFNFAYDNSSFTSAPSYSSLKDFNSSTFGDVDNYWQGVMLP